MSEEDKKPIKLVRMPDGSMRPATDIDSDIGSIWDTQKNIQLTEAQLAEQRKKQPKVKKSLFKKRAKPVVAASPVVVKPTKHASTTSAHKGKTLTEPTLKTSDIPTGHKEIAISVTVPKFSSPKHVKRAARSVKNMPKWVYAVVALVALPAILIGWGVVGKDAGKKAEVQGEQVALVPEYKTLAPNGDVTDTTSQKINYDASKKVASFTDKIDGYEVTVSMQPIPDTFKPAIGDNVKKVAEQFSATTVLAVDNGAAYLGTSPKGPQSFVGYRGDLLVFMKSETKIVDRSWADYFNSLK